MQQFALSSPEINEAADKAADLELLEDPNLQTKKELWLKLGEEFSVIGVPKEKISQRVHGLIEDRMRLKVPDEQKPTIKFQSRWYYDVMAAAGYVDPKRSEASKGDPEITAEPQSDDTSYKQPQKGLNADLIAALKTVFSYAHFTIKYAENVDYEIKENIPPKKWQAFLDSITLSGQIMKDSVDEKTKIPRNLIHIFKAVLQLESNMARAAEVFETNRLELIKKRINIITKKQAIKYKKGEEPNQLPLDEPDNADWALFAGFYGTQCPECYSWRVKPSAGPNVICIDCNHESEAKKRAYCRHCQTPLYSDKIKTVIKTGKCPDCKEALDLPAEIKARAG